MTLRVPSVPAKAGETFKVVLDLAGAGDIQGLSVDLSYDPSIVEPVGVEGGELLARQPWQTMVLSSKPGNVDVAVLGTGFGLRGSGELAQVTFRVKADGNASLGFKEVIGRNSANESLTIATRIEHVTPELQIPSMTYLGASYPNPFRGTTTIAYGLHTPGRVRISVFDVTGRLVRDLVDGDESAGVKQAVWDGRNNSGHSVGTGVYLVRLQASSMVFTRQIRVVR
jgi:hypothetical protein